MSSSDIALSVRGISKEYTIVHEDKPRTLAEKISNRLRHPLHRPRKETFRALHDVSFDVKKGEVVGIIGRNGAGKSTLLKILSRITEPTAGEIQLFGRVGSLLEVGTGFHPELTGRENIFLNGAILGMTRPEIRRHFDEIVAFAEVEKFLDTPVKRYSSGMYVRLAFAVAAHLNPEILIVDEVLSVGDTEFQKKCLGKMHDISKGEGRTVLFVSHNLRAVAYLCNAGILLDAGQLTLAASVGAVVDRYCSLAGEAGDTLRGTYNARSTQDRPYFLRVELSQGGDCTTRVTIDRPFALTFELGGGLLERDLVVSVAIRTNADLCVYHTSDEFARHDQVKQAYRRVCSFPAYALAAGRYHVDIHLGKRNYESLDCVTDSLAFQVEFVGPMSAHTSALDWKGLVGPGLPSWEIVPVTTVSREV